MGLDSLKVIDKVVYIFVAHSKKRVGLNDPKTASEEFPGSSFGSGFLI